MPITNSLLLTLAFTTALTLPVVAQTNDTNRDQVQTNQRNDQHRGHDSGLNSSGYQQPATDHNRTYNNNQSSVGQNGTSGQHSQRRHHRNNRNNQNNTNAQPGAQELGKYLSNGNTH